MFDNKINILMATYNGASYIAEQIESILSQTHNNWLLTIRDDGSIDDTVEIITSYLSDSRIKLISKSEQGTGSAKVNFSILMLYALDSNCNYFAFSDQDDIWHPDKLKIQIEILRTRESEYTPLLVHSDLEVVSETLEQIHPSFMTFQNISHVENNQFQRLFSQNFVTGCTCLFNRALLERALPISPDAAMHDWWLALTAAAYGEILFCDQSLIKYRQHAENSVGAKGFYSFINPLNNLFYKKLKQGPYEFDNMLSQLKSFKDHLVAQNGENQLLIKSIDDFWSICHGNVYEKLYSIPKLSNYRNSTVYILFFIYLMFAAHNK